MAILEDGVRHVGKQLVGPYSQFEFRHPGPLLYWVLWPLYQVAGQATVALHLGALLVNSVSLVGIVVACFRSSKTRSALALNVAAVAVFLRYLTGFISVSVDSSRPSAFVDIWNPVITILPFAAFCGACALVVSGRDRALPFAVVLHAFVCQTHVGYVPVATGMLAVALVSTLRSDERPRRAALVAGAIAGAACWFPTFVDAVFGTRNSTAIAAFFFSSRPRPSLSTALLHAAHQLEAPLTYAVFAITPTPPNAPVNETPLSLVLAVAEVALLVFCLLGRRLERRAKNLCSLALAGIVLAVFSAKNVDATPRLYPTAWFGAVGLFGWMVGLCCGARRLGGPLGEQRRRRLAAFGPGACVAVVVSIAIAELVRIRVAYREFGEETRPDSDAVPVLATAFSRASRTKHGPATLSVESRDDWELLAGVVLELDRRRVPFVLDEVWRFMFGAGHWYGRANKGALRVSTAPVSGQTALATFGQDGLYAEPSRRRSVALPSRELWVVESHGVEHDPAAIVAATPPEEGTPWDDAGAAIFSNTESWVELGSGGALIEGVDVLADANDEYTVEASTDGRAFREVARAPSAEGVGLRWRRLALHDPLAAPLLRIRPVSGDGSYSVASVVVRAQRWGVAVVGATDVGGRVEAAADGRIPQRGVTWTQDDAAFLRGEHSSLTLLLPVQPTESVELVVAGPARYRVEGSVDCVAFTPVGDVDADQPATTRVVQFTGREMWRCIRVAPFAPFGVHAVAEIVPRPVPNVEVLDLGTAAARVHLGEGWSGDEYDGWATWVWAVGPRATADIALLPGASYELAFDAAPHLGRNRPQRVTVRLNGALLGAVDLAGGTVAVNLEVPPGVAAPTSRLSFDFAESVSPLALGESDDPRPLAVRFGRIAFIRSNVAE